MKIIDNIDLIERVSQYMPPGKMYEQYDKYTVISMMSYHCGCTLRWVLLSLTD